MKSNYLDIEGGECVKKKMCFLIVLLFAGGCFVTPYDFVSAEEFVDHQTDSDDLYYSGKKTREMVKDGPMHFTLETTYHENGIVEAIVMENKHTTHIQYNPATGMTILNGVTLETKKEFEMGLPAYKEVYMGTVTNNVPAGTLVGAAISLTGIDKGSCEQSKTNSFNPNFIGCRRDA